AWRQRRWKTRRQPMATGPQTSSLTAWMCPHCSAVWHSGRQYCIDCGYGMAPLSVHGANGQAGVVPEGESEGSRARKEQDDALSRAMQGVAQERWSVDGTGFVPPGVRGGAPQGGEEAVRGEEWA